MFSGVIFRKDQRNIHKDEIDTNARLKNFSSPKNIDYIDNTNINEDHLGVKKLRHNKKGYSMFAQNSIKYLRSKLWGNVNLNCFSDISDEYNSRNLSKGSKDS